MGDFSFNLNDVKQEVMYNTIAVFGILLSGIFMGLSYYILSALEAAFNAVDCLIPNNIYFSTCQEWFMLSIYPVLVL